MAAYDPMSDLQQALYQIETLDIQPIESNPHILEHLLPPISLTLCLYKVSLTSDLMQKIPRHISYLHYCPATSQEQLQAGSV
jgi:hypothetical protein